MSEWQPMETAPKDRFHRVLITDGQQVREAYYFKPDARPGRWHISGTAAVFPYEPTHWQPMPAPPGVTGQEEG